MASREAMASKKNWSVQLDCPAGLSSWSVQLVRPAGPSSWSVQLVHPAGLSSKVHVLQGASVAKWKKQWKLYLTLSILPIASYALHLTHCINLPNIILTNPQKLNLRNLSTKDQHLCWNLCFGNLQKLNFENLSNLNK